MGVYKRGKTWTAQVSWYDEHGKRQFKSKGGFKTKAQANKYFVEMENEKNQHNITNYQPVFADYYKDWYETYRIAGVSKSTKTRYKVLYKQLVDYFGKTKITRISRHRFQQFMNDYGAEHAKSTVVKTYGTLKACVADAVAEGIIHTDFTRIHVSWNEERTRKIDYLNFNELQDLKAALVSNLNTKYTSRYMLLTCLYTGMRPGEIAVLEWKDLDFENNLININKSFDHDLKKSQIKDWDSDIINGSTKNESSVRIIKVDPTILNYLKQLKVNGYNHIFLDYEKKIPTSKAVNKVLQRCLKQCNINKPSFHFHSLRHSHVAMLLFKGVPLYAISRRLGHADMSTTAKKYAYMLDELKQKADIQIEKILDDL